jgi:hypothetical protein
MLSLALVGAYGYYLWQAQDLGVASAPSAPARATTPPPAPAAAEPSIRHPIDAPAPASLPTLDNSDAMMRDSIAGLIGRQAFDDWVIPKELVRRIVVTVDNLPRPTAPRRRMPLGAVPGALATAQSGEDIVLAPANEERYAPFVRVLQALNARALVDSYVRAYPLFQRAFEELGYPGRHFNDRLMEAIDDLLATPEVETVRLVRPRIFYEFADPDLETRSAGQKVLLRMGPRNAMLVKVKLREIRREIIAAAERR